MSSFLTKEDYDTWIGPSMLGKIIGTNYALLEPSERMAEQMVRDATEGKYNLNGELQKTGTSRNQTLVRWMLSIAAYFIYHDIADQDIPERVLKDYDDVRAELNLIASGKRGVGLDPLTEADGSPVTSFAWGSEPKRSHNFY